MAKCDRTGKRKIRELPKRKFELGYYLVVTDTEATERYYFEGLHENLPRETREKLHIEVIPKIKTWDLVGKCQNLLSLDPQYRIGWIVFDRDEFSNFNDIIRQAESKGIHAGWSNPCFEIWLYSYFGETPEYNESTDCCKNFAEIYEKKSGCKYSKSDRNLYRTIKRIGNEKNAIKLSRQRYDSYRKRVKEIVQPSEMRSCSAVFQLVQEIREKVNK